MFWKKKVIEPPPPTVGETILNGAVLGITAFCAVAGFRKACIAFDKAVPGAIQKIEIATSIIRTPDDDEDDDD